MGALLPFSSRRARDEILMIRTNSALKFRYQTSFSSKVSKSSIGFDEKVIATKGEHWEEMLENALRGWVEAVVLECRGGRDEE